MFLCDEKKPTGIPPQVVEQVLAFRDERRWRPFQNPKDLALSLTLEAAELLECFQWTGNEDDAPHKRDDMADELADVMIYALMFADRTGIDVAEAITRKLVKNNIKYPVEKTAGSRAKLFQAKERARGQAVRQGTFAQVLTCLAAFETSPVAMVQDVNGQKTVLYTPATLKLFEALKPWDEAASKTTSSDDYDWSVLTGEQICTVLAVHKRGERQTPGSFYAWAKNGALIKAYSALQALE